MARQGLRIRNDAGVDPEIKAAVIAFSKWIRQNYDFPVRIVVYIKNKKYIKAMDGELVSATCFLPYSKSVEPYARVSVGDYEKVKEKRGRDNALAGILTSVTHELTHYFRWIDDSEYDDIKREERKACRLARKIVNDYATTREHP